jgi:hypothetical protein
MVFIIINILALAFPAPRKEPEFAELRVLQTSICAPTCKRRPSQESEQTLGDRAFEKAQSTGVPKFPPLAKT